LTVLRALVLLLELLQFRLELLHRGHRLGALDGEGGQHRHDHDGQQGDGHGVVREDAVEEGHDSAQKVIDRLENRANVVGKGLHR
jgi:hypothetical protein